MTGGIAKYWVTHIASLGLPEITYHSPMNALSFGSLLWYIYGILHMEIVAYILISTTAKQHFYFRRADFCLVWLRDSDEASV